MNSGLSIALSIAATFVAIKLLLVLVLAARLIRIQLWAPHTMAVRRDLPPEWQTILDHMRPTLQAEGFRYTHTRKMRSINANDLDQDSYCDVYYHDGLDIHAEVYRAIRPTALHACDIYLLTYWQDGRTLLGTNGLADQLIPYPACVTLHDAWAASFAEQLQSYVQARAGFAAKACAPHEALTRAQQLFDQLWPQLVQEGQCYRDGVSKPGESARYRFRLKAALRTAWRMQTGDAKVKKWQLAQKKTLPPLPQEVVQALDRISFVRALQNPRSMVAPRWYQISLLLFSASAFLALGCWWWGWRAAIALALIVLLHELGHYLVMRIGKFRDVQVFFVPGMGGATSGEKHEASPLLHLAVYLAGPVPGLILALAVMAWLPGSGLTPLDPAYTPLCVLVVASTLINGLNLLPVLPLDGGRIASLLIMQRLPWFRFGFTALSALTLLYFGWQNGDGMTIGLSLLLIFFLPHQFRLAQATRALLRVKPQMQADTHDFRQVSRALQQFIEQLPFGHLNHAQRVALGLALLPTFMGRLPSVKETFAGLAIYGASIVVPLVALVGMLVWQPNAMVAVWQNGTAFGAPDQKVAEKVAAANKAQPDQAALVQKAQATMQAEMQSRRASMHQRHQALLAGGHDSPARFAAMEQAIQEAQDEYDEPAALAMARQLYAETASLPAPARERAKAAHLLVQTLEESTPTPTPSSTQERERERLALLHEASAILRARLAKQEQAEDGLLLAQVLKTESALDPANELLLQEQGLSWQEKFSAPGDWDLQTSRNHLANLYAAQGNVTRAEEHFRRNLAVPDSNRTHRRTVQAKSDSGFDSTIWHVNYGWFLLGQKRPAEALAQVAPDLARQEVTLRERHAWADALLLAAMVARADGNWAEVERITTRIDQQRPKPETDSFWLNLWLRLQPGRSITDRRASLLLLEAKRALGDTRTADKLLHQLWHGGKIAPLPHAQ